MSLSFTFNGTNVAVVQMLQGKSDKLMNALVEKMTYLMTELQEKAQAAAPRQTGALAESIRDPRAEVVGEEIIGYLDWGGDLTTVSYKGGKAWDYARILNEGSSTHAVNPLEESGTRFKGTKTLSGKSERRSGRGVLAFIAGGKEVFAEFAFPKGIPPNRFVEDTLQSMKGEIIDGLQATIFGVMGE